ncbi:AMP-binding protein [Actinophytocola sp.]|uniref:AMP-binding protein n=1 Tax=Actinophytocola sp. TaxID=1872138 RepID=UPI003D6C15BD
MPTAPARPPSILDGGPAPSIDRPDLTELLVRAATGTGSVRFIDADGTESTLSYPKLLAEAAHVLGGLRTAGAHAGDRVALVGENRDLIVGFWACVLGGFVAAPGAVTGCRWTVGSIDELRAADPDLDWHVGGRDDVVLLTRTAGSSGPPKPVSLSHEQILARTAATIEDNGLDSNAVTFNWMPLDHVGGLVMFHVRDVWLGCVQVHADRSWVMREPTRWLDAVDRHRATVTWATTSALEMIGSAVAATGRSWDLSRLGYLMNGGEPVRARTLIGFRAVLAPFGLPTTALRPGWGMTETCGGVVDHRLDVTELRAGFRFVPVGRPHPGIAVRVVDDHGAIVPTGTIGRLQVRGPSVASGAGWLDTADLASVRDGLLTVTGSAADALWLGGALHHAHELEATLAELPFVHKGLVGAGLVNGELAVAYHHDDSMCELQAATEIQAAIRAKYGLAVRRVVVVPSEEFPKTRTGKPQRSRLRELLGSGVPSGSHEATSGDRATGEPGHGGQPS